MGCKHVRVGQYVILIFWNVNNHKIKFDVIFLKMQVDANIGGHILMKGAMVMNKKHSNFGLWHR
jgi:hypothetical protein